MNHVITSGDVLAFAGGALALAAVIGALVWVLAKYAEGFKD